MKRRIIIITKIFFNRKNEKYLNVQIEIDEKIKNIVSPTYINNKNPDYLIIDEMYFSGLMINNFPRNINNETLENLLYKENHINYSIFFEKLNSYDVIKKITQNTGIISADLKLSSENKQDYTLVETLYNDAKNIRKEIQINNENVYNIYMYIYIYETSAKKLKNKIFKIQNMLLSHGFNSKKSNYRNLDLYKSIIPFNSNILSQNTRKTILTKPLSYLYPFISNNVFDENGILFGVNKTTEDVIIIDRFDKNKYLNSNMIVIGMSGAGKSYFIKLQILRNSIFNIKQLVIDPEGEYEKICKEVNGEYITLCDTCNVNIFDLYYSKGKKTSILDEKIQSLITFFSLVIRNISEEEKAILEDKIIKCYILKGITFDNETISNILTQDLINQTIDKRKMPIMQDLYNCLIDDEKCIKMATILKPFVSGSLKSFNNYTNIDTNKKLIIINISEIKEEYLNIYFFIIIELYWNIVKEDSNFKKIIYIDEIWKLLKADKNVANFLILIFKTIRKYNGAATAITQDIIDICSSNIDYGKAIFNNSYFKSIFKIDEENIRMLSEIIYVNEKEKKLLSKIDRGENILMINKNNLNINIISSEYEKSLIER